MSNRFNFLNKMLQKEQPIEDQPYPEAAQDAARNYTDISSQRRQRAPLENLPPEGLVLKSEPNLNILESSPEVTQLPPEEVEKLRGVQSMGELSEEDIRELLRQQMR